MDRRHRDRAPAALAAVIVLLAAGCTSTLPAPTGAPTAAATSSARRTATPSATPISVSPAPPAPLVATASPPPTAPPRNPAAYLEGSPYTVTIDPADFVSVIDATYWPMIPGMTTVFEGDGERIVVDVTDSTKVVMGVVTTVVRDRAYDKGRLIEDTLDWYAQDRWGNVWYFGEETTEYENGKPVSTAGSWEAGVDGALPGIVMLADPRIGDVYRNEFYAGEAEDLARIVELGGAIEVPAGSFADTLVTEDWTLLDPTQLERKTYAPGVGVVAEGPLDEPTLLRLVEVRRA
jgi:hypothetical protein